MADPTSTTPDYAERASAVLAYAEGEYVRALNAVLASHNVDEDVHRWRGHAEAYRAMAERLRLETPGLLPVDYRSQKWRDAHGVYTVEQVAAFRRNGGGCPDGHHRPGECCPNDDAHQALYHRAVDVVWESFTYADPDDSEAEAEMSEQATNTALALLNAGLLHRHSSVTEETRRG